jgi:YrbI family 3-deoxy-D-manno-octulosonate 8-phosphate phosphatase
LIERLKKITLLVMDCDGVLTDGSVYYSVNGEELLRFHRRDGHGIEMLHQRNIRTAIISSENSEIIRVRAEKMKIKYVFVGIKNKASSLAELIELLKIKKENIAYIGDDVNDFDVMGEVGVPVAVGGAVSKILSIAAYTCLNNGGEAAVREFIDLLLWAKEHQNKES